MAKRTTEPSPIPTELSVWNGVELARVPTSDLRAELARGLSMTADGLSRMGAVWAELERRGDDLSDLREGLAEWLPHIANRRLAAEAVVAFATKRMLLRALDGVPLEKQRALAAGEPVKVIDPTDPTAVQEMPLARLPAAAVRLVFSDGEVRTSEAQRLALRPRRKREDSERRYRPRYDAATGTIRVGRMTVKLADLLGELAASASPDHPPPAVDMPAEHLHVKVRLSREEYERFQALCRKVELPDWEMARKALRAFGLI